MVLILFPEEHIHPELSGRVLHSSPSRHGSISHHHFPITMDAGEGEHRYVEKKVSLSHRHMCTHRFKYLWTQHRWQYKILIKKRSGRRKANLENKKERKQTKGALLKTNLK